MPSEREIEAAARELADMAGLSPDTKWPAFRWHAKHSLEAAERVRAQEAEEKGDA